MKRQCVSRARARVHTHAPGSTWPAASWVALVVLASTLTLAVEAGAQLRPITPRSTTIALTSDNQLLVVVNRETNSVSVIRVRNNAGGDIKQKLAEIAVGREPRCVAVHPDNERAFVTNTVSGTVSEISIVSPYRVIRDIPVGTEPRGCALSPNGTRLYVANHTDGSVSAINLANQSVNTINLGGNPTAIAITNDDDNVDTDERVFVTDFFARPRFQNARLSEANDVGRQGVVWSFRVGTAAPITTIPLLPLANSGFTANRSQFCPQSFVPPAPGLTLHSEFFCPNVNVAPNSPVITANPQGVFPNQLLSALIRGNSLYLPNIGAQPEPPFRFNTNVQALVHLVNTATLSENHARLTNLNIQVAAEPFPTANPATKLRHLFGNDLVAIDATYGPSPIFLIVSRGGNFVFRAVVNNDGLLDMGTNVDRRRYQTGNLPNGVVISRGGGQARAYINNELDISVTAINLVTNQRIWPDDIPSGTPAEPGTFEHAVEVGKLAFHTALGIPDNDFLGTPIRDIVPLRFRGKASDNAWSSCASCHPDGLSDRVTWIFDTGIRNTIPLDATFAKDSPADQRILNWNAVRSSNLDFNQNSRGVQGGCGFASAELAGEDPPVPCNNTTPADPAIFNHGRSQGVSDALDVQTLWIQTVRPPILPLVGTLAQRNAGARIFEANCASCHGGAKWSKSQVVYADNPAFDGDPNGPPPFAPRDPGVTNAGAQIVSYEVGGETLRFLDPIGTFNANNPLEIRNNGITALGGLGFNAPALLGLRYHEPFFHDGSARNLPQVFAKHALGAPPGTIATRLSAAQRGQLMQFLLSLDGSVPPFDSDTDEFLDGIID